VISSPPVIHPGALEHYVHAESYETRYAARSEDVDYYLKLISASARVLEYGAGAGRLTLRLAKKGSQVCAVDASSQMITLLRERLKTLPLSQKNNVVVKRADMRTFRTNQRYDFVVAAFHTVGHLYSLRDIESFLKRAYTHLAPGGRIVFDLPLPRIDMAEYDAIAGVRVTEMDGPHGPELLTLRAYQPQETAMHLYYAGFRKIRLTSDFSSAPVDTESSVFVVTAIKPHAHET
jgi:SAM-dependent methyltransferase